MLNKQNLFENEDISVVLVRKPDCRIQAEITATPKLVKAAIQQATKTVSKHVSIPGFRKGKAPESFVLKHYAKAVDQELSDVLLNMVFRASVQLTQEYPFSKEFYAAQVKSLDANTGAVLYYDYETLPETPLIEAEQLNLKAEAVPTVTDADINNYIDNLITQKAVWHEITDRAVEENDFVDLDIEAIEENKESGETNVRKIFEKTRVHVVSTKMDGWMRNLVIGAAKDAVVEGMSEDTADHSSCNQCETDPEHVHHHSFTPTLMRITIHGIYKGDLPEFNDEFAKQYGADDAADLRNKVSMYLTNYMNGQHRQAMRNQIMQEIFIKYPFEIPLSTVSRYFSENINAIKQELSSKNLSEEEIAKEFSRISEQMKHDMRLYFLFQEFINKNKIDVTQEEVANEWMRQMFMKTSGQTNVPLPEDTEKAMNQIKQQLLRSKALDLLIEQKHLQKT